jgi:hypothetical protein
MSLGGKTHGKFNRDSGDQPVRPCTPPSDTKTYKPRGLIFLLFRKLFRRVMKITSDLGIMS